MKILLRQAESYGKTGISRGIAEGVRHEWYRHVALEESLCCQSLAEGVVSGEIDVDFVLSGRHLVVVLVNAAQHGDVFLEAQVELKYQVVFDGLLITRSTQRDDGERQVLDSVARTDDDFSAIHLGELVIGEVQRQCP